MVPKECEAVYPNQREPIVKVLRKKQPPNKKVYKKEKQSATILPWHPLSSHTIQIVHIIHWYNTWQEVSGPAKWSINTPMYPMGDRQRHAGG